MDKTILEQIDDRIEALNAEIDKRERGGWDISVPSAQKEELEWVRELIKSDVLSTKI